MSLLFILEENDPRPSGVVTVVKNKIQNWRGSDFIYVLINKNHWAYNELKKIKKKNYKVIRLNFPISDELNINIKKKIQFNLGYKLIRFFLIPIEFFLNARLFFYLKNLIKLYSIKTIFSHNGGWPGGILNRISLLSSVNMSINRILIIHNFPAKKNFFNFIFINLNNFIIKFLNIKIVTVSKNCKNDLISSSGLSRIRIIYNGLSKKIKKNKKIKTKNKKIHLNYFGKIEKRKGLHLLIKALNNIKFNHIILNIYGEGDANYKKSLKLLKKKNNYNLNFYKPVSDITKILDSTDILILPSIQYESFGMVLIEAMRQKVPIICSNSGGMTEIVKNERNGLIFKNNNSNDLKKKLLLLIKSKAKRKKLGNTGFKIFIKKFTNKNFLNEYQKIIYEK